MRQRTRVARGGEPGQSRTGLAIFTTKPLDMIEPSECGERESVSQI